MSTFEIMVTTAIKLWPFWLVAGLTFLALMITESQEQKKQRHQRMLKNRKEYYAPYER